MPPKRTRIVTKIGYVYQTISTKHGPRYFQLVTFDQVQLVSDVIVIFRPPVQPISPKNLDEIVALPIESYTHTTVSFGIREGLWHKIGKAPVVADLSALRFKNYHNAEIGEVETKAVAQGIMPAPPVACPRWVSWTPLDQEWTYLDEPTGSKLTAMEGSVHPPSYVLELIEQEPNPSRHIGQ